MTDHELKKLTQILCDIYKTLYCSGPFHADEYMKTKIEKLGGHVKFLSSAGIRRTKTYT